MLAVTLLAAPLPALVADEGETDQSCYKANGCPHERTCTGFTSTQILCRVNCHSKTGGEVGWASCSAASEDDPIEAEG